MRRALTLVLAALGVALVVSACGYEGTTTPKPSSVDGQAVSRTVGKKASAPATPTTTSPATTAPTTTAPANTAPANTAPTTGAATATGDVAAGKQIFTSMGCTACHTLKDAGATGTIGPNLDLLKPPAALVVERVTNGGNVMPPFKGRLTTQQIADVAAYVSSVAGK